MMKNTTNLAGKKHMEPSSRAGESNSRRNETHPIGPWWAVEYKSETGRTRRALFISMANSFQRTNFAKKYPGIIFRHMERDMAKVFPQKLSVLIDKR
jgi:hypothetical protein